MEDLTTLRARGHLVTGAIGAGKSRLKAAVLDDLASRDVRVIPFSGSPGSTFVPHGALRGALWMLYPDAADEDSALRRLYRDTAPANANPILVVEDAEHVDDASAAVIAQLVRTYGARCLLTARSATGLPEPFARLLSEGLVEVTALGWPAGHAERLGGNIRFAVDAAVDGLSPSARAAAELLAIVGPLPAHLLGDPATVEELERSGLTEAGRKDTVRLPHRAFADLIAARTARRRHDALRDRFAALRALATDESDLVTAVRLVGSHLAVEVGAADEAVTLGEAALDAIPHAPERARLERDLASWRASAGLLGQDGERTGGTRAEAIAAGHQRVAAAMMSGDVAAGRDAIARTRELLAAAGETSVVVDTGDYVLSLFEGDRARVDHLEAHVSPGGSGGGLWVANLAYRRLREGRFTHALRHAGAAIATLPEYAYLDTRQLALSIEASAAAQLGAQNLARSALSQLDTTDRRWTPPTIHAAEARAWLLLANGDADAATDEIQHALDGAARDGVWTLGCGVATSLLRWGAAAAARPFLEEAAAHTPVAVVHAALAVARDPDDARARARLHELGFLPALRGAGSGRLSAREREIAAAARRGASSREIAQELSLSVRTVETHLGNVYRKLGISSRADLPTWLTDE